MSIKTFLRYYIIFRFISYPILQESYPILHWTLEIRISPGENKDRNVS